MSKRILSSQGSCRMSAGQLEKCPDYDTCKHRQPTTTFGGLIHISLCNTDYKNCVHYKPRIAVKERTDRKTWEERWGVGSYVELMADISGE